MYHCNQLPGREIKACPQYLGMLTMHLEQRKEKRMMRDHNDQCIVPVTLTGAGFVDIFTGQIHSDNDSLNYIPN